MTEPDRKPTDPPRPTPWEWVVWYFISYWWVPVAGAAAGLAAWLWWPRG